MSKYTTEERNALWVAGEYVSLDGKPLTGIYLAAAKKFRWNALYSERKLPRADVEGHWLRGEFIDKWQQPLSGAALRTAQARVRQIRREQAAWRLQSADVAEK